MNELVEFWNDFDFRTPPFIHPKDKPYLTKPELDEPFLDHQRFIRSPLFGKENDTSLHLSLFPVPYQNNLEKADIIILLLNPGLGLGDYFTQADSKHTEQFKKIIRQNLSSVEYPFLSLDPNFSWTGGFIWWERKLRQLLRAIASEHFDGSYVDAMKHLSQRMATIELFPYHSKSFRANQRFLTLPSVTKAKQYIHSKLTDKAQNNRVTIIVMRQVGTFDLSDCAHIFKYKSHETRAAHLGPQSRAGEAVLNRIRASIK